MSDPFLGQIAVFSWNNIPSGWMPCDGRLLNIQEYTALYSLLSVQFGGDGRLTFALPDLRGRTPMGLNYAAPQGTRAGTDAVALTLGQMPLHTHPVNVTAGSATSVGPKTHAMATDTAYTSAVPLKVYAPLDTSQLQPLSDRTVQFSGAGEAHENRQPSLALSYCIATRGTYPMRPY